MKNKAFTLIELLAVIVILAIIALIATPIILGIIRDSKTQSKQRTAELVAKEVSLAYTSYMLKNTNGASSSCDYLNETYFKMDNLKSITCNNDEATVTMNNNDTYTLKYEEGKVTVSGTGKDVVVKVGSSDSSSNVVYRFSSDELYIGDSIEGVQTEKWCEAFYDSENGEKYCDYESEAECLEAIQGHESTEYCETMLQISKNPKLLGYSGHDLYLKHEIEDNKIVTSYACIYIEEIGEVCLQGGDTQDEEGNCKYDLNENEECISKYYEENVKKLQSLNTYFTNNGGSCNFTGPYPECWNDSFSISSDLYGYVEISEDVQFANLGTYMKCKVHETGLSSCSFE